MFLGGTVLLVAFQVLARIGFSRLILLGVDHDYGFDLAQTARTGFSGHELADQNYISNKWQPDDQTHIDLRQMERGYRLAHKYFLASGRQIFSATEGTTLREFPRVKLVPSNRIFTKRKWRFYP